MLTLEIIVMSKKTLSLKGKSWTKFNLYLKSRSKTKENQMGSLL